MSFANLYFIFRFSKYILSFLDTFFVDCCNANVDILLISKNCLLLSFACGVVRVYWGSKVSKGNRVLSHLGPLGCEFYWTN